MADAAAYERLAPLAVQRSADTLTLGLPTDGTATRVRALLDEIDPERRDVVSFTVHSASLDDVFMALTGRAKTTKEPTHV